MKIIQYKNKEVIEKIFDRKKQFHRDQAKLPIEEKIKILIELQKIVLNIRKGTLKKKKRQVWDL